MRRRLFWTIAGIAAITGLIVLVGAAVATQRAAIDATRRELAKSTEEVIAVIDETVERAGQRPAAVAELLRLLESDLGPALGRIRRTAGGSELAFGVIAPDGTLRTNNDLFARLSDNPGSLQAGDSRLMSTESGQLVMVTPTVLEVQNREIILIVALARDAPVVRLADLGPGLIVVGLGMLLVSAVLARLLSNQVVARLEPLSEASARLASGDLSARVPDIGDPDLDGLGESFNEMAGEIEATREREREFILGVGHDLRTPLTTIAGYAEALVSEDLSPDEVARIGGVLDTQSRQLGRLIEDIALLARLDQPEFGLRSEEVDAGAHVREVVVALNMAADKAGVELEVSAEPDLVIRSDPDRLAQIAQNLVENALRFTPEAGRVDVSVGRGSDGVVLSVSDTGVGIEADELPLVFDRHYVGRQRRLRNEGSGLGLSIVKGLAERLGGSVSAESKPGQGTTIRVSLPAAIPDGSAVETSE